MRSIFILLFVFLLSHSLSGQTCFPEGYHFTSQKDISDFKNLYPDCTIIEGDVCIGDCDYPYVDSDITNLNGLLQLTAIHGNIEISANKNMTNIQGLRNLRVIEHDLILRNNDKLVDMRGMDSIKTIGGDLIFNGNNHLLSTMGLEALRVIRGSLEFSFGGGRTTGLIHLDSIYGKLLLQGSYIETPIYLTELNYLGGDLVATQSNVYSFVGLEGLTEIGGSLSVTNNNLFSSLAGLQNVVTIHGNVSFSDNNALTLSKLSSLKYIGGNLSMSYCGSSQMSSITNLERIGGSISYSSNHTVNSIGGMDKLNYVGGHISINSNNSALSIGGFNSLDTLGGNLYISGNPELIAINGFFATKAFLGKVWFNGNRKLKSWNVPDNLVHLGGLFISNNDSLKTLVINTTLQQIDGDITIEFNENLRSFSGFREVQKMNGSLRFSGNGEMKVLDGFDKLRSIYGDLYISLTAADTLMGMTLLDSVTGNLEVRTSNVLQDFPIVNRFHFLGGNIVLSGIDSLKDLSLFQNLDSLDGDLYIGNCNQFSSFNGLPHATELGGGLGLSGLNSLPDLQELNFLTALGGDLTISGCHNFSDLSGLNSLLRINGKLNLYSNNNLVSLEGIHNIDPQSFTSQIAYLEAVEIRDNRKLTGCALENICQALRVYRKTHHISNNGAGCKDVTDIQCVDYGLSGLVYYDRNQNKQQDSLEFGIPGIPVLVQPGEEHTLTNNDGRFLNVSLPNQVYTLKVEPGSAYAVTTDSLQYTATFIPGLPSNKEKDFGLRVESPHKDITIHLVSDPTRCNTDVTFYLLCQNNGTASIKGKLRLEYDPAAKYISSNDTPDQHSTSNHLLTWNLDSIYPFQKMAMEVRMKMPDQFSSGDTLHFRSYCEEDSSGQQKVLVSFVYTPIVLCSFDPNDKLVVPAGIKDDRYVLFVDTLQYTVRFQNTGNAEAIDVTILDTLDQNLDMNTFKVIASSHSVYTYLDDQMVKFYFPNIWLPDSLSNEPESHGFVSYQVQAKDSIEEFTLVKNKADIIFDFNTPVITAPVHNTFVSSICDDIVHYVDTTICEGELFMGYATAGHFQEFYPIGNVCDSILDLYLAVVERNDYEFNWTYCLGETFYFDGEYYTADTNRTLFDTAFSAEGCIIWQNILHIIVNAPKVGSIDTTICEGQTFEGYASSGQYVLIDYNSQTECYDTVFLDLMVLPDTAAECITKTIDLHQARISLFPNPAHDWIYIKSDKPVHEVSLIRIDGTTLKSKPLLPSSTEISFELDPGILPGLYIIEAVLGNGRWYGRVMIN